MNLSRILYWSFVIAPLCVVAGIIAMGGFIALVVYLIEWGKSDGWYMPIIGLLVSVGLVAILIKGMSH